jgi:hypothetical protein
MPEPHTSFQRVPKPASLETRGSVLKPLFCLRLAPFAEAWYIFDLKAKDNPLFAPLGAQAEDECQILHAHSPCTTAFINCLSI